MAILIRKTDWVLRLVYTSTGVEVVNIVKSIYHDICATQINI